jgi:hypothetical protein
MICLNLGIKKIIRKYDNENIIAANFVLFVRHKIKKKNAPKFLARFFL